MRLQRMRAFIPANSAGPRRGAGGHDKHAPLSRAYFRTWNEEEVARPELGWFGFDGFDWDVEGNDDPQSPSNLFTFQVCTACTNLFISSAPLLSGCCVCSLVWSRYWI